MINTLLSAPRVNPITPVPGMGATMCMFSDRHAGTIVSISKSGKSLMWRQDKAIVVSGNQMDGSASYRYEEDPEAQEQEFKLRKNGRWVQAGESMRRGTGLALGCRDEYYDPSF